MTWAKFAAEMPEHPKFVALEPATKWLFVEIVCYCNRQLTDGYITAAQVRRLDVAMQGPPDAKGRHHGHSNGHSNVTARVAALQGVGLLEVVSAPQQGGQRGISGGVSEGSVREAVTGPSGRAAYYHVHDFNKYQPTRAEVLKQLAEGKIRAKRSRERRANGGNVQSNGKPRSHDPGRSVPKGKEVTTPERAPERAGARPSGGSRPTPIGDIPSAPLNVAKLRELARAQAPQNTQPPLPEPPPEDDDNTQPPAGDLW